MLPDINTDEGDVAQEWVLVSRGDDLDALVLDVVALYTASRQYHCYALALSRKEDVRASPSQHPGLRRWWC